MHRIGQTMNPQHFGSDPADIRINLEIWIWMPDQIFALAEFAVSECCIAYLFALVLSSVECVLGLVTVALAFALVLTLSVLALASYLHKLGVTVHWCLQGKAPQYLVNCCHPTSNVASRQRLRSSGRHHLVVPRDRRSMLGRWAFSVAGPMAWNALPEDLWDPSVSADNFRKTLKTHLFRNALGHLVH